MLRGNEGKLCDSTRPHYSFPNEILGLFFVYLFCLVSLMFVGWFDFLLNLVFRSGLGGQRADVRGHKMGMHDVHDVKATKINKN